MDFNSHNTSFEEIEKLIAECEISSARKDELKADIVDAILTIPFVENLSKSSIGRACDLEKDDNGRGIIDISNPHILENMEYFCGVRNYYKEHGVYTKLYPNKNPGSEYSRFWSREADRICNGMIREDGEWISGELYYYWNYSPILLTKKRGAGKRADRVKDFPNIWLGDYLWYHYMEQARDKGSHCTLLKMRGVGASFKAGASGPRKAIFYKDSRYFYAAYEKEYLIKDGVLNKAWDNLDFMAENTPYPRLRLKDTMMEKNLGYKDTSTGAEKGQKSFIMGVSAKDDPHKIRGKRGDILFEEHGVFPRIKDAWNTSRDSVEDGDNVFGLLIAQGTGGTENADFEGAEDMFRYPESYNIHGIPNKFDKNSNGKSKCGFFWGAYLNRSNCYDTNGNPDVTKALFELILERIKIKYNSSDTKALTQRKAEKPLTPDECVLRIDGTLFPIGELKEYLAEIEINRDKFVSTSMVGNLIYGTNSELGFRIDSSKYPIRDFPIKSKNTEGAIEVFELPQKGNKFRYIIGNDPIEADYVEEGSLGSLFVFDLVLDKIVAEYTGRPKFTKEFYENCLRLAEFYGARINYENNLKGLFAYFETKNKLHLLIDTPKHLKDQQLLKSMGLGNRSKGTPANKQINSYARQLIADWLLEERIISDGKDSRTILNLHTIRSIGLIKELIAWNGDLNADRVSAMGMVMIARQEYQKNIEFIRNPTIKKRKIYNDKLIKRFAK